MARILTASSLLPLFASLLTVACGPKVDPHSASASAHEGHAAGHEAEASEHEKKYDPSAAVISERCGRLPANTGCWYSIYNPTSEHLAEANKHREEAAAHRKASAALRDAEAKACVGVSDDDRDMSPFHHREDILRVELLGGSGKPESAVVVFRKVLGLSVEALQKVVDCHLARAAALGHDVPEMSYCPLVPKGARAKVSAVADGFAVAIDAETTDGAKEVVARARVLKGGK